MHAASLSPQIWQYRCASITAVYSELDRSRTKQPHPVLSGLTQLIHHHRTLQQCSRPEAYVSSRSSIGGSKAWHRSQRLTRLGWQGLQCSLHHVESSKGDRALWLQQAAFSVTNLSGLASEPSPQTSQKLQQVQVLGMLMPVHTLSACPGQQGRAHVPKSMSA